MKKIRFLTVALAVISIFIFAPNVNSQGNTSNVYLPIIFNLLDPLPPCTPPDEVNFTWSPINPTQGDDVSFIASGPSGTSPFSYYWNFGDGTTTNGQNITHTFEAEGMYDVNLIVTNYCGQSNIVQVITINPCELPLGASFSWLPVHPERGESVNFTAGITSGTPPFAYSWNWGDGSLGEGEIASHTYTITGTFNISLTVENGCGTDFVTNTITVVEPLPCFPPSGVSFSWNPTNPEEGDLVSFYGSLEDGTPPFVWTWTFGDGGTKNGQNATHTYTASGSYNSILKVKNACGEVTKQHLITVTEPPPPVLILSNHFSYTDSIDYLHIVGEVKNNTAQILRFVKVAVNIYDSGGTLLDTDFTYTKLDNLPPNDKACFDVSMQYPNGFHHYQFEPVDYMDGGQAVTNLMVSNDSGTYDPDFQWYTVLGEVTNNNAFLVQYVSPIITLYNASGKVVSCDFTYVNSTDLEPGQTSAFENTSLGRDYVDVTSYRIQVDGNIP